jgi:hypothetical protein
MKQSLSIFTTPAFALVFFLILWFGLACFSGSLFSGYHIADDHEIISIHNDFTNHASFSAVMTREITNDFSIRFRPLFYMDRIVTIKLLGDKFLLWSLYRTILAVITSIVLFYAARNFGFGFPEALLFPILTLCGTQSTAWFCRGPAEALATFLFAVALLCTSLPGKHHPRLAGFIFAVSCSAMALTKENYALAIPVLCLVLAYCDRSRSGMSWKACVRTRWRTYAFLCCFFITDLAIITFSVGTNQTGYAGIQINPLNYTAAILEFIFYNGEGLVCAACMLLFARFYKTEKEKFVVLLFVFLAFVGLQAVVYAKSGLLASRGRYVLPSSAAFGFVICLLLTFFRNHPKELSDRKNLSIKGLLAIGAMSILIANVLILNSDGFSRSILSVISQAKGHPASPHWMNTLHLFSLRFAIVAVMGVLSLAVFWKSKRIHSLATALVLPMLGYCVMSAFGAGREFSREGHDIRQCMDAIDRSCTDSSLIVMIADPGYNTEEVFSVTRYLSIKSGKNNIRYWFFDSHANDRLVVKQWKDSTLTHFDARNIHTETGIDSAQCLFFLKETERPFLSSVGFDVRKKFARKKWGEIVCYFHK